MANRYGPEPRNGKSFTCYSTCTWALDGFDHAGTNTLNDAIGTNNATTGSGNNGVTWNSAGYYNLNGASTSTRLAYTSFTPGNGSWTMVAWARASSLPTNTHGRLFSNSSGGPVASSFGICTNGITYTHYANIGSGATWNSRYGSTNLSTNTWYHCVWANGTGGNNTMIMYLNGSADISQFTSTTSNGGPIDVWGGNWNSVFAGDIACAQFFSGTTLTASQITKMYNAQRKRFGV